MPVERTLLFLSNGHGEDLIAAMIASRLVEIEPKVRVEAYPLVGEGGTYRRMGFPVTGVQRAMPTGGFILKRPANLWKDLRAGLLSLTRSQIADLKRQRDRFDGVVAVGDVYPLLLAGRYLKKPTVFVATAKSEYIRGHYRAEYASMRTYAVKVFARDARTAEAMVRAGVNAAYAGNVMMDALPGTGDDFGLPPGKRGVALLPGSRQDAYGNARDLLGVVDALAARRRDLVYLLSVAPGIESQGLVQLAVERGWQPAEPGRSEAVAARLVRGEDELVLVEGAFGDLLRRAEIVVGLAGTANEQAAGMGRPVVAFPGTGTQYTRRFAQAQKRLLGDALALTARDPEQAAAEVDRILSDPERYARMAEAGRERMGEPGGALRIAQEISRLLCPAASPASLGHSSGT